MRVGLFMCVNGRSTPVYSLLPSDQAEGVDHVLHQDFGRIASPLALLPALKTSLFSDRGKAPVRKGDGKNSGWWALKFCVVQLPDEHRNARTMLAFIRRACEQ